MKMTRLAPFALVLCFASIASAQKIAIVNPAKVFNDIQETKDIQQSLAAKRDALGKEEFTRRQQIKDLQGKRDGLKPDSAAYADTNKDLIQKTIEFEIWARSQQAQVQAEQKMMTINLFNKISQATEEVAKAKQIDLVISEVRLELPENLDQVTVEQIRGALNSRNILFSSPQVDISNDVIAAMDAKYKAGGK